MGSWERGDAGFTGVILSEILGVWAVFLAIGACFGPVGRGIGHRVHRDHRGKKKEKTLTPALSHEWEREEEKILPLYFSAFLLPLFAVSLLSVLSVYSVAKIFSSHQSITTTQNLFVQHRVHQRSPDRVKSESVGVEPVVAVAGAVAGIEWWREPFKPKVIAGVGSQCLDIFDGGGLVEQRRAGVAITDESDAGSSADEPDESSGDSGGGHLVDVQIEHGFDAHGFIDADASITSECAGDRSSGGFDGVVGGAFTLDACGGGAGFSEDNEAEFGCLEGPRAAVAGADCKGCQFFFGKDFDRVGKFGFGISFELFLGGRQGQGAQIVEDAEDFGSEYCVDRANHRGQSATNGEFGLVGVKGGCHDEGFDLLVVGKPGGPAEQTEIGVVGIGHDTKDIRKEWPRDGYDHA